MPIQLTLAARYLWGRKLRTLLTTLAVTFGVMIIFGLNGMIPTIMDSFRQNMLATAGEVDLAVTSSSGEAFSAEVLQQVRSVDGIAHLTGALRRNLVLPSGSIAGAVTVVGLDPDTAGQVRAYDLVDGRFLQADQGNEMVISENLAEQAGLSPGDALTLPSSAGMASFTVVGVITSLTLPGVEEVYVPLGAAQALFNQPGQINTVEAIFASSTDHAAVEAEVQSRLGADFKLGALESGNQFMASMQMGETVMNMFGLVALAMGGFIILNTFRTVVAERRRDLGMLRAVGATRRTVLGALAAESLLQGVVGTAVGLLAGYALAVGLIALANPVMEQFIHFRIGPPTFSALNFAAAIVLGVGVTGLSGLFPALTASRVTPLEALRPSVAEAYQRTASRGAIVGAILIVAAAIGLVSGQFSLAALGMLLFLVGLLLAAPALVRPIAALFGRLLALAFAREGQIAQGNLARQPGRAAITASVMMIGLAVMIAMIGLVSSLFGGFMGYIDKSLGADFLFVPPSLVLAGGNVGAGPELAQRIRDVPGVAGVTALRLGLTRVDDAALQVIGIDPLLYPQIGGLVFNTGDEAQAYAGLAAGRAVIVNGIFAAQNGVQIGDTLLLQTPEGDHPYQVVGVGMEYLNAKLATAYISYADLERDFHQTNDILLMADAAPGADVAAVHGALQQIVTDYPAFTLVDAGEWRATQEQAFSMTLGMLYLLVGALALPSLIALVNTLAINVIERTREIGMIRAVGGTQRQVRRMILAESLLLSAMGTAFGILAGLWLGYVMVEALAAVMGFTFAYNFPYLGVLVTVAIGLLFGVAAALLPARQAARLNIVTALHYE